ncbi:uncharacterized protein LOC111375074 [Olea europaea var. sylvestris]|uniref:uncharacterized protein LOC111375074 n=1 Tax=Olea europaea var. sylvestris TaxID=158386 RepID=UPI000C1D1A7F|nr:uncharacterized protein LOC111375074 [Olea europaea var. sylvestris]
MGELLHKGFIRESLSPCAVLALLIPKKDSYWRIYDADATIFSKIDLKSEYHQIRIRPRDEWKTTFKTKNGLYEWLQNKGTTSRSSHASLLYTACYKLVCQYSLFSLWEYADPMKIWAIVDWLDPKNIHEVRSFHDLATFYRRFIKGLSTIMASITEFFEVECDVSGVGIGGVLSQESHPIAYFNEKLNDAKQRYSTYNKELYIVVQELDTTDGFRLEEGYLFRSNKLCIPKTSVRDFIVWESHAGGLAGHFGRNKTIEEIERQFY